jgi:hypothetical protein
VSPNKMRLICGKEAKSLVKHALKLIREHGPLEAFHQLYVKQHSPALLLSSWVFVRFQEDALWKVEILKEKGKKSKKPSLYTLVYRNRRQEQALGNALQSLDLCLINYIALFQRLGYGA